MSSLILLIESECLQSFGSKMMPSDLYIMEDFLRSRWKGFSICRISEGIDSCNISCKLSLEKGVHYLLNLDLYVYVTAFLQKLHGDLYLPR